MSADTESPVEFPKNYAEARRRFRAAAIGAGWSVQAWGTGDTGPDREDLTVDAATLGAPDASRLLVVSSGLHGVEGPFGSAVQTAALLQWRSMITARTSRPSDMRALFIHALNPYGFAWSRRTDSQNVDANRNLLRPGEAYASDSSAYREFDQLLNPRRPPSSWSMFPLRMLLAIARHGRPRLKQALVTGQYDFPKGLFFGGHGPTVTNRLLTAHAPQWFEGARLVIHLDLHTGLGNFGTHKLLVDDQGPARNLEIFRRVFGADLVEAGDPDRTSYRARGHFGHWATGYASDRRRYLYACAEFGTYGNIAMLSALRAENQAHHWTRHDDPRAERARAKLRNMFCPSSPAWRTRVLRDGIELVAKGAAGLAQEPI